MAAVLKAKAVLVLALLFLTVMLSPSDVAPVTTRLVVRVASVLDDAPIFNVLVPALKVTEGAVLVPATAIVTVVMPVSIPTALKAPVTASETLNVSMPVMVRVVGVT